MASGASQAAQPKTAVSAAPQALRMPAESPPRRLIAVSTANRRTTTASISRCNACGIAMLMCGPDCPRPRLLFRASAGDRFAAPVPFRLRFGALFVPGDRVLGFAGIKPSF